MNSSQKNAIRQDSLFTRFWIQIFLPGCPLHCMIDGSVHAGPQSLAPRKATRRLTSTCEIFWKSWPTQASGSWQQNTQMKAFRKWSASFREGSLAHSFKGQIPKHKRDDLIPTHAGVRAQALMNGKLVDDFLIVQGGNSVMFAMLLLQQPLLPSNWESDCWADSLTTALQAAISG